MEAIGSTRHCYFIGGTWKQVAALDIVTSWRNMEARSSTRHCYFIGGTWKQVAALDIVTSLVEHGSK